MDVVGEPGTGVFVLELSKLVFEAEDMMDVVGESGVKLFELEASKLVFKAEDMMDVVGELGVKSFELEASEMMDVVGELWVVVGSVNIEDVAGEPVTEATETIFEFLLGLVLEKSELIVEFVDIGDIVG